MVTIFFPVMIWYYEENTRHLICHAYYFAAIESLSPLIMRLAATDSSVVLWMSVLYVCLMLFWMFIYVFYYENDLLVVLFFIMKIFVYLILALLFYNKMNVSSNPELLLLGLYFNSYYYIIYLYDQEDQAVDNEEETNEPEVPVETRVINPEPETDIDRYTLPSYEESFNYPNV